MVLFTGDWSNFQASWLTPVAVDAGHRLGTQLGLWTAPVCGPSPWLGLPHIMAAGSKRERPKRDPGRSRITFYDSVMGSNVISTVL